MGRWKIWMEILGIPESFEENLIMKIPAFFNESSNDIRMQTNFLIFQQPSNEIPLDFRLPTFLQNSPENTNETKTSKMSNQSSWKI
jgi:hypothetical protein